MRLAILPLCLLLPACLHYSVAKSDVVDNTHSGQALEKRADNRVKSNPETSNAQLWDKIVAHPDSVSLDLRVNDSLGVILLISGTLQDSQYYKLSALKVTFSNGIKQDLPVKGSVMSWTKHLPQPLVRMEDVNFDGNADLLVFDNAGAVNYWYEILSYKPQGGFVYNKDCSEAPSPKLDTANKLMMSYYRFGYCEENVGYYSSHGQKLVPVKYIYNKEEHCPGEADCQQCIIYQKQRVGKTWKTRKVGVMQQELYDSLYEK